MLLEIGNFHSITLPSSNAISSTLSVSSKISWRRYWKIALYRARTERGRQAKTKPAVLIDGTTAVVAWIEPSGTWLGHTFPSTVLTCARKGVELATLFLSSDDRVIYDRHVHRHVEFMRRTWSPRCTACAREGGRGGWREHWYYPPLPHIIAIMTKYASK